MNPETDPLIGRRLEGRYRIDRHLADGGMGSVYVAHDERLARDVALKVLRADLARDPAFVARFQREAQAAARLNDPHVVAVHDQGQDDGYTYLAMELVRGRTLRDLLEDPRTTFRERLDVFDQVLAGLAAAHADGLAHRDIKPENVLIDASGHVKVADFGLARAIASTARTSDSDVLLGTASYLSPEQVEQGRADARSDVYASGLVLYELLSGTRAFDGSVPIHVAYQHVHADVPALDPRTPAAQQMDALIARACAKDPHARPRDAAQLRAEFHVVDNSISPAELDRPAPLAPSSTQYSGAATASHTTFLPRGATQVIPGTTARKPPAGTQRVRWALTALGVLVVAVMAWLFLLGPFGPRAVPDVHGQLQGSAVQRLHAAGFDVHVQHTHDDQVPNGQAVRTSPRSGSHAWPFGAITLDLSSGPRMVAVPAVTGLDEQSARNRLASAGLTVSGTAPVFSTTPSGQAAGTQPSAGTSVRHDSTVSLNISQGPAPVTVPDVTGQDAQAAETTLKQSGLSVTTNETSSATVPKGKVISTDPGSGTTLHTGDSVTISASSGPEMVTVPDVTGMNASDAANTLQGAGFSVDGVNWFDNLLDRTVSSQSPTGGGNQKAPKGSTITLGF